MKVAIMKYKNIVIVSMRGAISDMELTAFEMELLDYIGQYSIKGVIIDVSIVDVIDSFGARMFASLAAAAKFKGAECMIVGIQPTIALTMSQLGIKYSYFPTALSLDEAMDTFLNKFSPEKEKRHAY